MSLRRRLFLTLCLIVLLGFFGIAQWIRGELRNSYSQVVEEILVDNAHLISAFLENSGFSEKSLNELMSMFKKYRTHAHNAKIFEFVKDNFNLETYITNDKGIVIAATQDELLGKDYSQWNDVYKTLKGEYGARSTHTVDNDSRSSVYFIAAPIIIDSKIVGVATVYKTEKSILLFLDRALNKMFVSALFSVLAIGIVGGLVMLWITLPLEKLRRYALDISEGKRGELPISKIKEVRHLTDAFEKMRISLEGKKTIEKYTQTLTHELKSPLTAIKGAAELSMEEMDPKQQQRFLKNIIEEANRSHLLLEQLLKIAAVEAKQALDRSEPIDIVELLNETSEALMGLWKPKGIAIDIAFKTHHLIQGDRFLLFQSVRNILQNAIEFSEPNTKIAISIFENNQQITVSISDQGAGIPDFAKEKIFEKFFSLERPDTKKKSSGLGLSFVKEVMELHKGQIQLTSPGENQKGTTAKLIFPLNLS